MIIFCQFVPIAIGIEKNRIENKENLIKKGSRYIFCSIIIAQKILELTFSIITPNGLRIIKKTILFNGNEENILKAIDENNQLISIFVASIKTSKGNFKHQKSLIAVL